MRHWRYNAHAGVLQPRIAPFKLATRFSVSIFSGDLIICKVGLFVAAATPDPSAPTILIVQTMRHHPEILVQSPKATGGLTKDATGRPSN